MHSRFRLALATLILMGIAAVSTTERVLEPDMAPSVAVGDWVWMQPGATVYPGDIVRLADPLDPARTILRRVIAGEDATVQFDAGGLRVGTKRIRQRAMGQHEDYELLKETIWAKPPGDSTDWLIRHRTGTANTWTADTVTVPPDHWYLVADDRDNAVDSRWWGPVPKSAIEGVVRIRVGTANTWRPRMAWLMGKEGG